MTADRPLTYWTALARMGFEEDLARLMEKKGVLKADLAKAINTSAPFITQVLNGTNNYTLKTMVKLARAVGAVVEVRLADEGSEVVRVMDVPSATRLEPSLDWQITASSSSGSMAGVVDIAGHRNARVEKKSTVQDTTIALDLSSLLRAHHG